MIIAAIALIVLAAILAVLDFVGVCQAISRVSSIMNTSCRFQAICALCMFTAQQSYASAAIASKALFVFSAKHEVNGPVDLVRMEGNKIVSRTSLGFNVARAASSTKMVAFGVV